MRTGYSRSASSSARMKTIFLPGEPIMERPDYPDTSRDSLLQHVPAEARVVLDVGCAKGAFGRALKSAGEREVWGVEPDEASAALAGERLDHVINDFFGPANPLPEQYFDLITFNDSLEHMSDPVMALDLCHSKLKPGGRIHCCVPNVRHIENLEHLILNKDWHYEEMGVRDRTHLRFFTRKSIVALFEERGYRVIDVIGVWEDWWDATKPLRRLLFRFFPEFTRDMRHVQILVIAERATH